MSIYIRFFDDSKDHRGRFHERAGVSICSIYYRIYGRFFALCRLVVTATKIAVIADQKFGSLNFSDC